jgi:hypothetical protein
VRRITRALVVCALAAGLLAADVSGSARAVSSSSSVRATATSSTAVTVTWTAKTSPNRWWVIVTAADDRSVGQRTACGTCRRLVVAHLAPNSKYFVRLAAVSAEGAFMSMSDPVAVTTRAQPECSSVGRGATCVTVDARFAAADATGVGTGVLHGVTPDTDSAAVTALKPKAFRVSAGDMERFALARRYGGTVTVILSDYWMTYLRSLAPWAAWDFYKWWVGVVVDSYKAANMLPDYWEVQNEPALPGTYQGGDAPTAALVMQQYTTAAKIITEKVPGAKVIGPSTGYVTFGSGLGDVDQFLATTTAAGVAPGAVTWHEIGGGCLGYCDGSPRAVLQHADDVRASIAAVRGAGAPVLDVNEWGAPWNYSQPGAAVGYLSSLAYAGISVANPACWDALDATGVATSSCQARPGTLDGLLLPDGKTPTDAWWAHKAYADMTGPGFSLLDSTIADAEASVIATTSNGTINVLLGRSSGCQSGVDLNCPGLSYAPVRQVQPVITVRGNGSYRVTVTSIPSVAGALTAPKQIDATVVRAKGGRVTLGSYSVGDGDALAITLVPA